MLSAIYKTDLPDRLRNALLLNKTPIITVEAPTGFGKTFMINHIMADVVRNNDTIIANSLMPFRVSVRAMHKYLTQSLKDHSFDHLSFGYAMKDDRKTSKKNLVVLKTVGYWLEEFFRDYSLSNSSIGVATDTVATDTVASDTSLFNKKNLCRQIFFLDEIHDASWQTNLAINVLIWLLNQGANITIIMASATFPDQLLFPLTSKNQPFDCLKLTIKEKVNINRIFCSNRHPNSNLKSATTSNSLSVNFRKQIQNTLNDIIASPLYKGNILVILPGMEDITSIHNDLFKDIRYQIFLICPLYSQLSRDEIEFAIETNGIRKIILATNMVENAITIKNLEVVIDCGYRKVMHIDNDGVQQLLLEPASQANMVQASGRVGREGNKGYSYLMLTEAEFMLRPQYSDNETSRNPYYQQLVKLVANNLPVYEILPDSNKVTTNIAYLVANGILEICPDSESYEKSDSYSLELEESEESEESEELDKKLSTEQIDSSVLHELISDRASILWKELGCPKDSDIKIWCIAEKEVHIALNSLKADQAKPDKGLIKTRKSIKYKITACGNLISYLPLSIKAGRFLSIVLMTLEPKFYYIGCLIAAWMDTSSSIWYRGIKTPKESNEEFEKRMGVLKDQKTAFLEPDCLMMFLKVWASSWIDNPSNLVKWCLDHGVFYKSMHEIDLVFKNCLKAVQSIPNVYLTKKDGYDTFYAPDWNVLLKDLKGYCSYFYPAIKVVFSDWVFMKKNNTFRNSNKPVTRFVVDRSIEHSEKDNEYTITIVAVNIRKINDGFMILLKIIDVETLEEKVKREELKEIEMENLQRAHFVMMLDNDNDNDFGDSNSYFNSDSDFYSDSGNDSESLE